MAASTHTAGLKLRDSLYSPLTELAAPSHSLPVARLSTLLETWAITSTIPERALAGTGSNNLYKLKYHHRRTLKLEYVSSSAKQDTSSRRGLDASIALGCQSDKPDQHGIVCQRSRKNVDRFFHPPGQNGPKDNNKSRCRYQTGTPRLVKDHDSHGSEQEDTTNETEPEPLEEGAISRLSNDGVTRASDRIPLGLP